MQDTNEFDEKARDWDADPAKIERSRLVAEAIREEVQPSRETTALECGCGTGAVSLFLQPYLKRIVLADSSRGMLEVARAKIDKAGFGNMEVMEADFSQSVSIEERFDLIYSLLTLHHIPDTTRVLKAFHGLLKPGGSLCIADLDKEDGSFHGHRTDLRHGFDRKELQAMAVEAGFKDVRFRTAFSIDREVASGRKSFPVFMMTCGG